MNDLQTPAPPARGPDLLALVELALARSAGTLGASQAEAAVSMDVGLSVSVRLGEVETVEYQRDRGMGVTVYFGTRKGAASTADLSRGRAPRNRRQGLQHRALHGRGRLRGTRRSRHARDATSRISTSSHPWAIEPEAACELARRLRAAAMAVDTRITNSEGAGVSTPRAACARTETRTVSSPPTRARCTASAAR